MCVNPGAAAATVAGGFLAPKAIEALKGGEDRRPRLSLAQIEDIFRGERQEGPRFAFQERERRGRSSLRIRSNDLFQGGVRIG